MTRKFLLHGFILAATTLLIWIGFSQIDFMRVFKVREKSTNLEQEVGDMLWKQIRRSEQVITKDSIVKPIEKLFKHMAEANNIDSKRIKLHVIKQDQVNAFAMPGDHIVIYTGLLDDCNSEAQLAGVLGHELAHLKRGHVMKKLAKEVGLSVLISMTSGNGSGASQVVRSLTSSAYDRSLETEADITAVEYLMEAGIDPRPMADFLYSMGKDDTYEALYWVSTHPNPEERAKEVLDYLKNERIKSKAVLTKSEWQGMKSNLP